MATIAPSITVSTVQDYNRTINVLVFASRLHVDIMDGVFAKPASINLVQTYWPEEVVVDIHMMVDDPASHVETLVAKQPQLIILHAESATYAEAFSDLKDLGMRVGLAILPETQPDDVPELIDADHCLIFGGKLGSYGGTADLKQLQKIEQVKAMNPDIEIGWDGGANMDTLSQITGAGVDTVNVGSAIMRDPRPQEAYNRLVEAASR